MASSVISSAAAQASMVAPFTGHKSASTFPVRKKSNDITSLANNGGRVQCMQVYNILKKNVQLVWLPIRQKNYETLSYLPDLSVEQLVNQIDYLIRLKLIPCIEFELEKGFVYRENARSPGYYDGRYWTMWKLPMFRCSDASQVLMELEEAKNAYPDAFIRIIGFDNIRQVQVISFIASKAPGN